MTFALLLNTFSKKCITKELANTQDESKFSSLGSNFSALPGNSICVYSYEEYGNLHCEKGEHPNVFEGKVLLYDLIN